MTTTNTPSRVEEIVAKILKDLPRYAMTREDKMWGLKKLSVGAYADISDLDKILTEALTEAHQAGIDEAVEILKKKKKETPKDSPYRRNQSMKPHSPHTLTTAFRKGFHQALNNTIKALQDNK